MRKTLIINSAKGGVGKTAIATGLANSLAGKGERVYLLDLDVTTPNIAENGKYILLSSPVKMDMSKTQLKKFIRDSYADLEKDCYVIIDTPPTITSTYSAIAESIKNSKFIFVTTPSENAKQDTALGIKFFAQRGLVALGLVQNMVGDMFGQAFDSQKEMGIETITEIPLMKGDKSKYFDILAERIAQETFLQDTEIEQAKSRKIMKNISMEDIKKGIVPPLAFYNLETWGYFREKLVEKDLVVAPSGILSQSRYDVDGRAIQKILDMGETANVMIKEVPISDSDLIPWEIQEAEIVFDNPVSKGLPMFRLKNGMYLWMQEVMLTDSKMLAEVLENGGIDLGQGRIVQSLIQTLYMQRAFVRQPMEKEIELLDKYLKITQHDVSPLEVAYMVAVLEQDRNGEDFENFSVDEYKQELEDQGYAHISEHIDKMMEVAARHQNASIAHTIEEPQELAEHELRETHELSEEDKQEIEDEAAMTDAYFPQR